MSLFCLSFSLLHCFCWITQENIKIASLSHSGRAPSPSRWLTLALWLLLLWITQVMSSFSLSPAHAPLKPQGNLLSSIPADERDLFPPSITQGFLTLFKSHLKALQWQQMPRFISSCLVLQLPNCSLDKLESPA